MLVLLVYTLGLIILHLHITELFEELYLMSLYYYKIKALERQGSQVLYLVRNEILLYIIFGFTISRVNIGKPKSGS